MKVMHLFDKQIHLEGLDLGLVAFLSFDSHIFIIICLDLTAQALRRANIPLDPSQATISPDQINLAEIQAKRNVDVPAPEIKKPLKVMKIANIDPESLKINIVTVENHKKLSIVINYSSEVDAELKVTFKLNGTGVSEMQTLMINSNDTGTASLILRNSKNMDFDETFTGEMILQITPNISTKSFEIQYPNYDIVSSESVLFQVMKSNKTDEHLSVKCIKQTISVMCQYL